jgi:tetratricopeptide (TPR) repeat protein
MIKKHILRIFVLASILIIIILVSIRYQVILNNESSILSSNTFDDNIILLKKKGKNYVNKNNLDSLKFIVDKINISDTSQEVQIFRLYDYLVKNDTTEFKKLLKTSQNINSNDLFYLVNIGSILLNADYYNEALKYYLKADSLYENKNVNVILNIAVIYTRLDENVRSIEILTKAINSNKTHSDLYYGRSIAYYNIKKYYDAVIDLNSAISIDKVNPNYYYLRGTILKETGNFNAGEIDLTLAYKYGYKDAQ